MLLDKAICLDGGMQLFITCLDFDEGNGMVKHIFIFSFHLFS